MINYKPTRFPIMFSCVMSGDNFENLDNQSCYKCQIKCGLIESGRYILVCDTLSGFSLELFSCQDFINLRPDSETNCMTIYQFHKPWIFIFIAMYFASTLFEFQFGDFLGLKIVYTLYKCITRVLLTMLLDYIINLKNQFYTLLYLIAIILQLLRW